MEAAPTEAALSPKSAQSQAGHPVATDPIAHRLHAGPRHQGREASLRDDLRPLLTPDNDEQVGWLPVRWLRPGLGRMLGLMLV
jgi:hypothetical protein